jgi:hypothetical protein
MSPVAPGTARMRDLDGQVTIVLWPKSAGSNITPSPIMDVLSSATNKVKELQAQLNAETFVKEEKQKSQGRKSKPGQELETRQYFTSTHHFNQDCHPPLCPMLSLEDRARRV